MCFHSSRADFVGISRRSNMFLIIEHTQMSSHAESQRTKNHNHAQWCEPCVHISPFPSSPCPCFPPKNPAPTSSAWLPYFFFLFKGKLFFYENRGKECKPFAVLYYILAGMSEGWRGGERKERKKEKNERKTGDRGRKMYPGMMKTIHEEGIRSMLALQGSTPFWAAPPALSPHLLAVSTSVL